MPKIAETPKNLKPFLSHRISLDWEGREQAIGDCPFCGKKGKFGVNVKSGLWNCLVCSLSGNVYTFLQTLWKKSDERMQIKDCDGLKSNRGYLYPETLIQWGICRSIIDDSWLIPGFNIEKKVTQLYRYVYSKRDERWVTLSTAGIGHALYGVNLYDPRKHDLYLCEGPWDGMALWETMQYSKSLGDERKLALTGNKLVSLIANANVLAVPGCSVFNHEGRSSWLPFFKGKRVILLYDSDHPRENSGVVSPSAGHAAMKRVSNLIFGGPHGATEISYIKWGDQGHDPTVKSGYDVRDYILSAEGNTRAGRVAKLEELLGRVKSIPEDWISGRAKPPTSVSGDMEVECLDCRTWSKLVVAWKKALKWTSGLERALSVMLASVTSTKAVGDQLWIKIIGPAACGKSTLCEALSVNKKHILAKSTLRGFHSGYDDGSGENHSPLAIMIDKTLVIKDGDTLLQSPNLQQILSEARDIYDRTSRSSYRTKQSKDWQGINLTIVLCGTSSLRALDSSELGERFLDCVIMDGIDDDLEDEILLRVAHRAEANVSLESDGKLETQHDPAMVNAMQLTGGYVGWLRSNASQLLSETLMSDHHKLQCIHFGKFVAYMRARPSVRQEEIAEREFASRLVSQLIRLAKCLAVVLNRKVVDDEVVEQVRLVSLDTARGSTLEIAEHLFNSGTIGLEVRHLSLKTGHSEQKEYAFLRFLRKIGAVEWYRSERETPGVRGAPKWRLTDRLQKLYKEVMGD